jgi:uncharacterized protein (TIGR03382 family)
VGVPASHSFVVDLIPPGTGDVECPPDPNNSRNTVVGITQRDPAKSFECDIDGAGFKECLFISECDEAAPPACTITVSFKLGNTPAKPLEGKHHLEIRAKDVAGNVDPNPAICDWSVVIKPPMAPVITEPGVDSVVVGPTATIRGTAENEGVVNVYLEQRSESTKVVSVSIVNGKWEYTPALEATEHTVIVDVTDKADNTGPTASVHFTVVEPKPPGTTGGGGFGCAASSPEPWLVLLLLGAGSILASRRRRD